MGLSHLDESGAARMVDVGQKAPSRRVARATGRVRMQAATLAILRAGGSPKGDVLQVGRIAGIQAAKETSRLIPLCHPLPLEKVSVDFSFEGDDLLVISTEAAVTARTGVEMEALTAVAVAALTVYDMLKAVDRGMRIEEIRLDEKTGGKSDYRR
jgi:cyclic pyranopterin phosphate synthase